MLERLEDATQLLADAAVDRILFHCTAVSMYSPDIVDQIRTRVASVTSIPLVVTSDAVVTALRAFDAHKIVLLTPYTQDVNDRELRFLASRKIEVLAERGLACQTGHQMIAIEPQRWYDEALSMRDPRADAYFLSCTTIRTAEMIEPLERALGKPVITSNQVAAWQALREQGITDQIAGFGSLFRDH